MIDASQLRLLGWSDSLIDEVMRGAQTIATAMPPVHEFELIQATSISRSSLYVDPGLLPNAATQHFHHDTRRHPERNPTR